MSMVTKRGASPIVRTRGAALLALPAFLAFTVPLVGFLLSLLVPLLATRVRPRLWPGTTPITGHLYAALVVIGLWLPALSWLLSAGQFGSTATVWLIIPLCTPAGSALLAPAATAIATYLLGLGVSTLLRHPLPWVLGAWTAPWAYEAASRWLVHFTCIA